MVVFFDGPRIEVLSNPEPTHRWSEMLCDQQLEHDRLFQLIASLANLLDKAVIVETVKSVVGIEPVELEDCILFGDLSIKFGDDGRVIGLSQTLDGSTEPAKSIIQNLLNNGQAT